MLRQFSVTLFASISLMLWIIEAPVARPARRVAPPADIVGTLSGSCTVQGYGERGKAVRVGDTVIASARCKLELRMTNGSEILLSSGSRMSILSSSAGGTDTHVNLTLTQGLLQAVLPSTSGSPSFEISTPVGTASVRSGPANWFVYSQADSAQVGVLEGTVDLTSAATRRSVSIPAHWGTRLESNRDPVLLRIWPENQFDGFRRLTQ